MAPGHQIDEMTILRQRLAQAEAAVEREKAIVEERFKELLDTAPLMVWASGPDGLCAFFNRAWLDFRGRTLAQEAGNGWADGLHPEDRELCVEAYLKAFAARQSFRAQARLQKAN